MKVIEIKEHKKLPYPVWGWSHIEPAEALENTKKRRAKPTGKVYVIGNQVWVAVKEL